MAMSESTVSGSMLFQISASASPVVGKTAAATTAGLSDSSVSSKLKKPNDPVSFLMNEGGITGDGKSVERQAKEIEVIKALSFGCSGLSDRTITCTTEAIIELIRKRMPLFSTIPSGILPAAMLLQKEWDDEHELREAMLNSWYSDLPDPVLIDSFLLSNLHSEYGNFLFFIANHHFHNGHAQYSVNAYQWMERAGVNFDIENDHPLSLGATLLLTLLEAVTTPVMAEELTPVLLYLAERGVDFGHGLQNKYPMQYLLRKEWDDRPEFNLFLTVRALRIFSRQIPSDISMLLMNNYQYTINAFYRLETWQYSHYPGSTRYVLSHYALDHQCLMHNNPATLQKCLRLLDWSYHYLSSVQDDVHSALSVFKKELCQLPFICSVHFPDAKQKLLQLYQSNKTLKHYLNVMASGCLRYHYYPECLEKGELNPDFTGFDRALPRIGEIIWRLYVMKYPFNLYDYTIEQSDIDKRKMAFQEAAYLSGNHQLISLRNNCVFFIASNHAFSSQALQESLPQQLQDLILEIRERAIPLTRPAEYTPQVVRTGMKRKSNQ